MPSVKITLARLFASNWIEKKSSSDRSLFPQLMPDVQICPSWKSGTTSLNENVGLGAAALPDSR